MGTVHTATLSKPTRPAAPSEAGGANASTTLAPGTSHARAHLIPGTLSTTKSEFSEVFWFGVYIPGFTEKQRADGPKQTQPTGCVEHVVWLGVLFDFRVIEHDCSSVAVHIGNSLIQNIHPPRTSTGHWSLGYRSVLGGGLILVSEVPLLGPHTNLSWAHFHPKVDEFASRHA